MPDYTPDPVPPPGKPKIGLIWIAVALIFAFVIGAWLYFATKGAGGPGHPGPRAALIDQVRQA